MLLNALQQKDSPHLKKLSCHNVHSAMAEKPGDGGKGAAHLRDERDTLNATRSTVQGTATCDSPSGQDWGGGTITAGLPSQEGRTQRSS